MEYVQSMLVLLHLSVAFNTIDYGILLGHLSGVGLGGTALQWFQSFLEGRTQRVVPGALVPQGSVCSLILFNIYVQQLEEVVRSFEVFCHQYVDDTQLYLSFLSKSEEAVSAVNPCLCL